MSGLSHLVKQSLERFSIHINQKPTTSRGSRAVDLYFHLYIRADPCNHLNTDVLILTYSEISFGGLTEETVELGEKREPALRNVLCVTGKVSNLKLASLFKSYGNHCFVARVSRFELVKCLKLSSDSGQWRSDYCEERLSM